MQTHCDVLDLPHADDVSCSAKNVNKAYLVNKLNFINFKDESITVHLKHSKYDNTISLAAKPLPCAGERLDCSWIKVPNLQQILNTYNFGHLLLNDGKKFLMVSAKVISMGEEGLSVLLPIGGREFKIRKIKRHPSHGIGVQLTQDGALLQGSLCDFTPVSLRVEGKVSSPQTFKWLNVEAPVYLHLYVGKKILYSGSCRIIRYSCHENQGTFVLTLTDSAVRRFIGADDLPQQLFPSPNMIFPHPFIGKNVSLPLSDMSGSSFTVEESEDSSVLMPGMMIPDLKLSFGQHLDMSCKAQVVSRSVVDQESGDSVARCTLAILDMDIHEHVKLLSILHQANDRHSYVCNSVDMEALWDFFFETGFVYPKKYAYFQANKEKIKATYQRLYSHSPHIARHFIYQDKGAILGHIAMLRFFENSWMIHHHAARKTVTLKAGMSVLNQISHYVHVLRNFHFAHLSYVYCYYRPDNKFPNRVFGGFASILQDRRGCSLDKFAFSHHYKKEGALPELPSPWEIKDACDFDVSELRSFYGYTSGGLMIDAFELHPEMAGADSVAKEYQKLGFKKEKRIHALYCEGMLKAVLLANSTDAGLNMANLTNCITLFVLDETIPLEILDTALDTVSSQYEEAEVPVLTYPFSFVEKVAYPFEKVYTLWVLNLSYLEQYREYTHNLFRGIKKSDLSEQDTTS